MRAKFEVYLCGKVTHLRQEEGGMAESLLAKAVLREGKFVLKMHPGVFCLHSVGQNGVIWLCLAARKESIALWPLVVGASYGTKGGTWLMGLSLPQIMS